jgi:UPF0755 protein
MLLLTIYGIGLVYVEKKGPLENDKVVVIDKGLSSWSVSKLLAKENIIDHNLFFWVISNITMKAREFKAGEYEFKKNISPKEVIRILSKGLIIVHKLVIPEGLTNKEVISLIEQQPALAGNIVDTYPEGYLMGNTYHYVYGDRRQMLVEKIYADSIKFIDEQWTKRDLKLPLKSRDTRIYYRKRSSFAARAINYSWGILQQNEKKYEVAG